MTEQSKYKITGDLSSLEKQEVPGISILLGIVGALNCIGGVILCVTFWRISANDGHSLALMWLFSGLVSGLVLFAAASALTSIKSIAVNTKRLQVSLLAELLAIGDESTSRAQEAKGGSRKTRGSGGYCPVCGKEVSAATAYCPHCDAKLRRKVP